MIKQMGCFEVEEVMTIWLKTNIIAHNFIEKDYWIKNYKIVKEEYLQISETFIYKEDGIIKGFISVIDNLFIGALFVLNEYHRKGVGRKLLKYCQDLYYNLELTVYLKNTSSVNFYKHCGFIVEEEKENEDSGFMEYVMRYRKF
ncbi:N-acetyltransferase [Clostridium rectalis]|uniref:N-acetyltransferase n=1 Tax=Clostridium rectalis TaxID=2040295 RepID=UPI000F62F49E|nr:N-acetyltransferase [Clostridium rectalis]